jgi:hypothetical protein
MRRFLYIKLKSKETLQTDISSSLAMPVTHLLVAASLKP